ncbi:MAG: hypothetical protein LBD29_05870 [Treponema sp.]|jgi:hypothetical protein|nr:hypothetical protein [Treponema sp.]
MGLLFTRYANEAVGNNDNNTENFEDFRLSEDGKTIFEHRGSTIIIPDSVTAIARYTKAAQRFLYNGRRASAASAWRTN